MPLREFQVWDELNSEEEHAKTVQAWCPEDAAVEYADTDQDGHADGLYREYFQPLIVQELGPEGKRRWRVEVGYELVPTLVSNSAKFLEKSSYGKE